ncbi:uncharacterized protein LOC112350598 [Selaginella moellendorffii]|uniref:uncharacterized protein LOC112350598 n=1 Tax=Selaginella moellendorffii TaxID=88036 RepID=UPI000D1C5E1A|nr:uncharacterized protein LOC112350598 [Selaginella moellendorffii]|eukprot:XP_024542810.1 uncharacterized protein LOC112350598 [Selaginella moellendorffii]
MTKPRRKSAGCDPRLGTGGVTEVQIAFLVDCYLKDRSYAKTLREFRTEAASVLAPCKTEAPMKMMSLSDILNDYIALKEQALSVQSERLKLESFVASVKEMVASYEKSRALTSLAPGPPPSTPAAPITHVNSVPKRKTSPRGQEAPMLDITNTAIGTKRIRHCPVLPTRDAKPAPFTPSRPAPIDPQTPQQFGLPIGSGSFQVAPSEFLTPSTARPTSCEPSKARSKRQQVKPTTRNCKSLDFTTSSEPLRHAAGDTKTGANEKEKALERSSGLPVDILCEDFFTTEPLSSIDDILGTSLDGTSFSELMNSMMAEDMIQEISSPSSTRDSSDHNGLEIAESDSGFVAEIICVEDDQESCKVSPTPKSTRKACGNANDENTPP